MLRIAALFFVFVMSGCSWLQKTKGAQDLNKICQIAGQVEKENIQDPAQKAYQFAKTIEEEVSYGDTKTMMQALASADPQQKWELLQKGAAELGVKNYECPALQKMWAGETLTPQQEGLSTKSPVYEEMKK